MILAAFILVAAFFAIYILLPFWEESYRKKRLEYAGTEKENLILRKNEILEAMRDLEYDFKMQKVSLDDYSHLKESLTKQAVEVMKKLDSTENQPDRDANDKHSKQQTGNRA
ncbi:hypothetical protein L0222_12305 [bacterium]|nr:hypothetical protein [bacterium]MCI0602387.1 hypothetical protein [bacterium]